MPNCHTCKYDGKKSRRCITCPGPAETNHHGKSHVELDTVEQGLPGVKASGAVTEDKPATPEVAAMRQAARFVLELMHLDRRALAIVKARLVAPSRPIAAISKSMGITDKATYARLHDVCREFPAARILLGIESTRGRRKQKKGGAPG